jgi:hypothetical protein
LLLEIFSKINRSLRRKVVREEPGLYLYLLFPIALAFILTFGGARILNHLAPDIFWEIGGDLHIHHYTYGFFVLVISGYLALIFNGPRATYLVALLHGFGLGLAFDEFGMWLRLSDNAPERWNYDGFLIVVGLILAIITAKPGVKMLRKIWNLTPMEKWLK